MDSQQHVSARHYLNKPLDHTALQQAIDLTASHFRFPIAQLNVLDGRRQHTLVAHGAAATTLPRSDTLCDQVVRRGVTMALEEFAEVPSVMRNVRSYLGAPISGREGMPIGSVCVMDMSERHVITDRDRAELAEAAGVFHDHLELLRRIDGGPYPTSLDGARLAAAVRDGEILPHYQPIVDIRDGRVLAVEALARWQDPLLGILEPAKFLPLAESTDIIIDLDLAIIRQAAADVARWVRIDPSLRLNVNLSAQHFDHPECVDRLLDAVTANGLEPAQVTFEITETTALAVHPGDRSFLHELREHRFAVVLDDFGSGYSSLDQVLRLPVDGIKLDRTVASAIDSRSGDAVLRLFVRLADELDLSCVLEGVESPRQAARAIEMGCRTAQGFLWAPPRSAARIPGLLHGV